jgi:hypothetical protein
MCYISLKGQYQEIGEAANGFSGQIDCICIFNLIPFHKKMIKEIHFSPEIIVTKRSYRHFSAREKNKWFSPDLRLLWENFSSYIPPPSRSSTTLEHLYLNFLSAREEIRGNNCPMRGSCVT